MASSMQSGPRFHMALPDSLRQGIDTAMARGSAETVAAYVRGAIRQRLIAEGITEAAPLTRSKRGVAKAAPPRGKVK